MLRRWLGGCFSSLALLHCGSDSTGAGEPVVELSLVSFNTALGVGLAPYPEQRLDAIEAELPELGADVVCLQEVWLPENIERLTSSLRADFPYSHRSVRDERLGGAACTATEAALLSNCCRRRPARAIRSAAAARGFGLLGKWRALRHSNAVCVRTGQDHRPVNRARARL